MFEPILAVIYDITSSIFWIEVFYWFFIPSTTTNADPIIKV